MILEEDGKWHAWLQQVSVYSCLISRGGGGGQGVGVREENLRRRMGKGEGMGGKY